MKNHFSLRHRQHVLIKLPLCAIFGVTQISYSRKRAELTPWTLFRSKSKSDSEKKIRDFRHETIVAGIDILFAYAEVRYTQWRAPFEERTTPTSQSFWQCKTLNEYNISCVKAASVSKPISRLKGHGNSSHSQIIQGGWWKPAQMKWVKIKSWVKNIACLPFSRNSSDTSIVTFMIFFNYFIDLVYCLIRFSSISIFS